MTDEPIPDPSADWLPDTVAVRAGTERSAFGETSEALFATSGYVYETAAEAAAAFAGESDRYIYSRLGNPTVSMFEERLRRLEGAEGAWATASGMAAVFNALAATLRAGDRVVAARGLFGSCFQILDEILPRWDVRTDFVDGSDLGQWERALATPAQAVFFETPSNPMQELVDIAAVSELAHAAGARVIVDNVFATPVLQRPLELGADVVVYSTTKHLDGHGRTMGGAILGTTEFLQEELRPLMRHTGPVMAPFNAWVVLKSLETLALRVERQTASALALAAWLEQHPAVEEVRYPMLASHPQHELAVRQMTGGGSIVTFWVPGGTERAFEVIDRLALIDISNNLGDAKSLVTHPATTTHHRIGPEVRAEMGVTDGVIRISVGLEDPTDLQADLDQALSR
ncbi:O-succinylhomoserine sulfhydrylase [Nitriliruptor alkaliphilus]|uniref:O-succinylhomoserine sulfhydrylase n=1 Tax=Nitriliruptor alkaliphilus TaxID=427918 RepID=UPI000695C6BD|nr:O-succinylhomoserine sulfhydrylase [Nitriliruptor alkaliphilus]